MKKKLVLTAAVIAALSVVSCNGKKTNSQGANQDSLSYAENDSLNSNDVILDSIAGTYEGTLPAADCPGIKTVLTLNADSTYQYSADYLERKEFWTRLNEFFSRLSPSEREVFRLKFLDGLCIREIAEVMEKNESTIKTHLYRAVEKFRRESDLSGFLKEEKA